MRAVNDPSGSQAQPCIIVRLCVVLMTLFSPLAYSAAGVIVYESRGLDTRRTQTGHAALVLTQVCAEGINSIRPCREREPSGVVISRYANLAWGRPLEFMVVPLRDHFWGTDDPAKLPLLTTGPILQQMQIEYWRSHWRNSIPPMSEEEYRHLRKELSRITLGKTLKYIGQFEFMMKLLSPPKRTGGMEPIALRDPLSGELIRDGRWRGILGTQHERDAYVLLTHTSPEQELELSAFLEDERHASFNLLTSNCSDFIGRALTVLFRERRYRTQSRMLAFSDSFITSPISLASNFVRFTKRNDMPLAVFFVPQMPGSRAKSEGIRSTTAGTLSPSLHQGLLAFGVKAYLLRMNLMVPALGFAADRLSFNVNLDATVNQKALPLPVLLGESPGNEFATAPTHADLVTYFGTRSCWGVRTPEFKRMLRFSVDKGIIPAAAVRRSKTRLWPANLAREMEKRQLLDPATVLRLNRGYAASFAAGDPIPTEDVSLLVRYLILAVNADLNKNALDRRSAPTFDRDWTLLAMTLTHLGYSVTPTPSVATCSSEEINRRGSEVAHERAAARSFARTAGRGFKAALQGSIR